MGTIGRRTFLELAAVVTSTRSFASHAPSSAVSSADTTRSLLPGHLANTYPENVSNPLVSVESTRLALTQKAGLGWEEADFDVVVEEILRLDPEFISEWGLQGFEGPPAVVGFWKEWQAVRTLSRYLDIPFQMGVSYHLQAEPWFKNWYRDLPTKEKWRHPDGTVVEHPREIAMQYFDGTVPGHEAVVEGAFDSVIPSLYAGGTIERLSICGADMFEFGANHFFIDLLIRPIIGGLDFSHWAKSTFREHLQSLSDERLRELEIDAPAEFDIHEAIDSRDLTPEDVQNPFLNPLFREYNLFQHNYLQQFVETVVGRTRSDLPASLKAAGTSVYGEGHWLQWMALHAANIYLSDHLDIIHINLNHSTVPPDRPHDVSIKLGRAVGRFEKPVITGGRLNTVHGTVFGLDPSKYYPTLMRFQIAQSYTHGGRRPIQLTSWGALPYDETIQKAMRPDGTVAEEIHDLVDFIQAHRRFLTDFTEANQTAVVVSLPTLLHRAPQWGRWGNGHRQVIGEAATVLRENHVPYDVLVFDHPSLWEAPVQRGKLADYNRVILPAVESVSDAHVAAIEDAIDSGTQVILTAEVPTRDENYRPREDVRELVETRDNAVFVEGWPSLGDDYTIDTGPGAAKLADLLVEGPQQIELSTDADISVNVFSQSAPTRVIIHLLNFNYDPATDSMPIRENFELRLRDAGTHATAAKYYTVRGSRDLEITTVEDGIRVTIPRLEVWGFVVFGEDESALDSQVGKETAKAAIAAVQEKLDQTPGRRNEATRVSAKLANSRRAFEYEAYGVARDLAREALSLWHEIATPTPTETPSPTPTPSSSPTVAPSRSPNQGTSAQSESTEANTPGFGFGSAIGGVLGAAALFSWLREKVTE